jgi:hypothetical protein
MTDVLWGLAGLMDAIGAWAAALPAALDQRFGVMAPVVAGAAAAIVVALVATIHLRGGRRSSGDILRHGVAAAIVVLGLLALAVSDVRHAALAYLGLNLSKPAVEYEMHLHLPKATATAAQTRLRSSLA